MLSEGDVVPVICHVGSDSEQQQMVLSAKVLSVETTTTSTTTNTFYAMQFLCDHSIERVSYS